MTRDCNYSQLYSMDAGSVAPRINDFEGFKDALSQIEGGEKLLQKAEYGERSTADEYPKRVYKTLLGFAFYSEGSYCIPGMGVDEHQGRNEDLLNWWGTISEYTEPFYVWHAEPGSTIPTKFTPSDLRTQKSLYRLACEDGEVSVEKHTLGVVNKTALELESQENSSG